MICSLLALQSSTISDEKMLAALSDSECRVRSMALIHEQLYRSKSLARINMRQYFQALAGALTQACGKETLTLTVLTDVDDEHLTVDSALPCGLMVNELVTNCIKHAFPMGTRGEIKVAFKKKEEGGYLLEVGDNGRGIPDDIDWRTASSLGLRLVKRLAEYQLGGNVNVCAQDGTVVTICLPVLI
jgi:two-component sensor histidine kinase